MPFEYKIRFYGNFNSIVVTGSFDNWQLCTAMKRVSPKRNGLDAWEVRLVLDEPEIVFKFVADGNWTCSELYDTRNDDMVPLVNAGKCKQLRLWVETSRTR